MATAYAGTIVCQYQDGYVENIPIAGDDVTTNSWTGPDGLTVLRFSSAHGNGIIRDIILSPAAASCRTATIRFNGKLIPDTIVLLANNSTTVGRQFQAVPLRFPAGCTATVTQVT